MTAATLRRSYPIDAPANEMVTWSDDWTHVGDALQSNVTSASSPQQSSPRIASFDEPVSAIRRNVFYRNDMSTKQIDAHTRSTNRSILLACYHVYVAGGGTYNFAARGRADLHIKRICCAMGSK